MESQNYLAAINDTLNVLSQLFDAMEACQDSSDARFKKLCRNFVDKCDMGSHLPFTKMASPISVVKSNQVVLKLQSFHEEKIRAREKADEFFSQFRQRYKPKTRPCLRPILKKFKKVHDHGKHHDDDSAMFRSSSKFQESFGFFRSDLAGKNEKGFDLLDKEVKDSVIVSPVLDSDCMKSKIQACILGSAFLVSNVQKSNFTDHGYERVGSVEGRFKSPNFSISDGIVIDFLIRFNMGFILDAKQMLIPTSGVGFHLGHNVFNELPQSTNNCVLQLGYHMSISDSGGTLITGHFTSKFQVKDAYNSKFLVCDGEFLKNDTTDLRDEIKLVVSNFCDKKSDESKILAVGFVGLYQFMKAKPTILENECQKEWVGIYAHLVFVGMQQTANMASLKLGFHEFIRDKGGTKFLSSFESMDLWASCEDSGFCVDINRSMGYYCKGIRLFEMMRTSNFTVDSLVDEVLLQSLCKNLRLDDAIKVLEEMMETGLTPPNNVFAFVVYVFCKLGKVDDAMKFLEDKQIMETSACNVLLQGWCSTWKFLMAEDLLVKMSERNVADCISWNIVIRCLSENARIREDLWVVISKMLVEGCNLDLDAYCVLIQSMSLQNRMKECLLLFNMMVDEGIRDKGGG